MMFAPKLQLTNFLTHFPFHMTNSPQECDFSDSYTPCPGHLLLLDFSDWPWGLAFVTTITKFILPLPNAVAVQCSNPIQHGPALNGMHSPRWGRF